MAGKPLFPQANNTAPASDIQTITPSDTVNLPQGMCRGIYVGVTGNISVQNAEGNAVILSNVPVGILPVMTTRVNNTSTTATNMVALY